MGGRDPDAALDLWETHPGPPGRLVPTLVSTEVVSLLATRLGVESEVRFLGDLAAGAFTVEPNTAADSAEASGHQWDAFVEVGGVARE